MLQDLKKVQIYGGKRISFENDEINQIKNFGEIGKMSIYEKRIDLYDYLGY